MDRKSVIASKLKEARLNLKFTQKILAEKMDEPQANISKWENGFALPPTSQLATLCSCLEISIDELLDNRSIQLNKSKKLIEFGRDVLELMNVSTPEDFYNEYQLINKEQILVFPEAACEELLIKFEKEVIKNCSAIDNGIYYRSVLARFADRWLSSENVKKIKSSLHQYPLKQEGVKRELLNSSMIDDLTRDSELYKIIKDFITFWIWVNQIIVYIANDLTKNGLQLIIEPITDEEFFTNKKYFPLNPGIFVYRILLKRLYTKLITNGIIDEKELASTFKYHFEDVNVEQYFNFAKEKFNYINKVTFY